MELTRKLSSLARLSRSAENWWSRWCWRYTLQGVETASGVIASQGRGKAREAGAAHQKYTAWPGWLGHTAITFTITVYSRLKREISLERMTFFTTVHKVLFLYALSAFNKLFKLRACKKCAHKELTQSQSSYWLKY